MEPYEVIYFLLYIVSRYEDIHYSRLKQYNLLQTCIMFLFI